jgi:tetratricopeptide (TPR) repeat protein
MRGGAGTSGGGGRRGRAAWFAATGLIAALLLPHPALADAAAKNNEGNRLYEQKKFDEAMARYTDAQASKPDAPELHYNIGNVLLRKGDVEKAIAEYQRAQAGGSPAVSEAAHFNRGNALLQKGDLQPAIDAYVQALRLDPKDPDAKRNLELALRLLQQKQQQKPKDQDKKNDQDQKQPPPPSPQNQPKDEKQPQPAPKRSGEMNPDEAKQILDALRENEKENVKKHAQASAPPHPKHPEKDW